MPESRIFFEGNPWPEGHAIKDFKWTTEIRKGKVWFLFHLETADYYAEKNYYEDDDRDREEDLPDWEHPVCWSNYHSCILSSDYWHNGGFPVCPVEDYSPDYLDGLGLKVDTLPSGSLGELDDDGLEKLAFQIYLLGFDAVANHTITFTRQPGSQNFTINWHGKVALLYVGEEDLKYSFRAEIFDVAMPDIQSLTENIS